jgi:peptidylprolyl isomerase
LKASATPPAKPPTKIEFPVGLPKDQLATKDLKPGAGATAKAGDEVTVQYVGLGFKTKKAFDSSWEGGEPLSFELGAGKVIEGWDQGIEGMKVGGRREMLIPAKLAYGSEGTESIAPNEDLLFIVDLLAVKPGA